MKNISGQCGYKMPGYQFDKWECLYHCTASWFKESLKCHYQTVNEPTGETGIGSLSSSVGHTALHIKHTACLLFYFYHSKIHETGMNVKEHIIMNLQEKTWHKVHPHWHMFASVSKRVCNTVSHHFFIFSITNLHWLCHLAVICDRLIYAISPYSVPTPSFLNEYTKIAEKIQTFLYVFHISAFWNVFHTYIFEWMNTFSLLGVNKWTLCVPYPCIKECFKCIW
jgi:hypothetical protein